jgi:hypothetical protein
MRYLKFSLAVLLCTLISACRRPDIIRLQPTIEEPPASMVQIGNVSQSSQLVRGFYDLQNNTWRWAAPRFSVALASPPAASKNGAWLVLSFRIPDVSIDALKSITVTGKVGDAALPPETFTASGDHTYHHEVPAAAFRKETVLADFTVDKFLKPPGDGRDLALVVTAIGLEAK